MPMKPEPLEVLRRSYGAIWGRNDLDAGLEMMDSDFEWVVPGHPHGSVRRGSDEVKEFFVDWLEPWEEYHLDYDLRPVAPERVLVMCRMRGRGKQSQAEVEMSFAQVWDLRGGKPVKMVLYLDTAKALAAAGAQ